MPNSNKVIGPDGAIEVPLTDYELRIKALEDELKASRKDSGVDAPALDCSPVTVGAPCPDCSCAIIDQFGINNDSGKGIGLRIQYLIPEQTTALITKIIKVEDWDSDSTKKHKQIIKHRIGEEEITDDDRQSGHLVGDFTDPLDEDSDYYIIQIIARNSDGSEFAQTPPGDLVPGDGVHSGQYLTKFHTEKLIPAVPAAPTCADIVVNEPNIKDTILGNAVVDVVIHLSDPDATIESLDIDKVIVFFLPLPQNYPSTPIPSGQTAEQRKIEIDRSNLIDEQTNGEHKGIRINTSFLSLGRHYAFFKVALINAAGRAINEITYDVDGNPNELGCIFWSGGRAAASDSEIPLPSIVGTDDRDGKFTDVDVSFPQDVSPILLKFLEMWLSYDGLDVNTDPNAVKGGELDLREIDDANVAGTHTVTVRIHHRQNIEQATWKLQPYLIGVGKIYDAILDKHRFPRKGGAVIDFVPFYGKPTATPAYPALAQFASTVNTDTEAADAFVTCVINSWTTHSDGTPMDGRDGTHSPATPMKFKEGHVGSVTAVLTADVAGTTEKHSIHHELTETERNQTSVTISRVIEGLGNLVYWKRTKFGNGMGITEAVTTTPIAINLGGLKTATSNADVPVPVIVSVTQQGNKQAKIVFRVAQGTPAYFLKQMPYEQSLDGGATWSRIARERLKSREDVHIAGSTTDIPVVVHHPSGQTGVLYRVRIEAAGANFASAWITSVGLNTAADAPGDTGNPGSLGAPSVNFSKGKGLICKVDLSAITNINSLKDIQWYVGNANTYAGSTVRMHLENPDSGFFDGTWFSTGQGAKLHLEVSKRKLQDFFAGSDNFYYVGYRIKNASTDTFVESPANGPIPVPGVDITDYYGLDPDGEIPLRNFLFSGNNLIVGGHFLNSLKTFEDFYCKLDSGSCSSAGDEDLLGENWKINTPTGSFISKATRQSGIIWSLDNHWLDFAGDTFTNSGIALVRIRKGILPGGKYAFSMVIKAASAQSASFIVELYDQANAAVVTSIPFSLMPLTTSFQFAGNVLEVPTSYVQGAGKLWLRIRPTIARTYNTYIDAVCLYRFPQILGWMASPREAQLDPDTGIATDTGAENIGMQFGNFSGGDYSATSIGTGGIIIL